MVFDSRNTPDTHVSARTGLAPPAVSIADPIDGLLAAKDLNKPVTVSFPTWGAAIDTGSYQLKWDGDGWRIGEIKNLPANPIPGTPLTLEIPATFWAKVSDGEHQLCYMSRRFVGGAPNDSPTIPIIIDRTPPGGDLLAPMADDGLIDNADGRQRVAVHVLAYTNAQAGDAITLLWGRVTLHEHLLAEAEVGQPVLFSTLLTYATLVQGGEGLVKVRYEVRRQGSLLATSPSLAVQVRLELAGPQDETPETLVNEALAAPIIKGKSDNPNRQDNVLDEDDYRLTADAVIEWQPQFQLCDQINLFLGSSTVPLTRPINQNDLQAATATVISLPNELITREGVCKPVSVHYTVTHAGNPNTSYSPAQAMQLISRAQLPGGEWGLPAPLFTQVSVHNTLELSGSRMAPRCI